MSRKRRIASFLFFLLLPAALSADVLNRIVLRVNDQIATLYDYQQRREEAVREISRREQNPAERRRMLGEVGALVFKEMYEDLLLQSRADQMAVEISEGQIDTAVAQMRQNFGIHTDEEFAAALAQSGMTEQQLREQVRANQRVREVMGREVQSKIKVDEEDLRRYYRKHLEDFRQPAQLQLHEVVVLEEGGAPAEERPRIAAAIRQAVAGGRTLEEAVADSAKRKVTSSVIDLGWVTPTDLDPNLAAAAQKLQKGGVSEPVAGRGGLHVLQLVDRRESRIPPFSEVASTIQAKEQERVYRDEVTKYMADLEKHSLIVADPPQEAANFRSLLGTGTGQEGGKQLGDLPSATAAPAAAAPQGQTAPTPPTPPSTAPNTPVGPRPPDAQPPGTLPKPKPVTDTPPPPGVR
jgi:peptidyl-prolyl cis-trans isomerase SurA